MADKQTKKPTQAELEKRAKQAGYTLSKEKDGWYAEIHGTSWGPMGSAEELDEFLPKE